MAVELLKEHEEESFTPDQEEELDQKKRANPRYFIMLCGISCELSG
jgi:hypothetical protein